MKKKTSYIFANVFTAIFVFWGASLFFVFVLSGSLEEFYIGLSSSLIAIVKEGALGLIVLSFWIGLIGAINGIVKAPISLLYFGFFLVPLVILVFIFFSLDSVSKPTPDLSLPTIIAFAFPTFLYVVAIIFLYIRNKFLKR